MKHKLMILFGAYLLIFILSLVSCDNKDDCNFGSSKFRVTGLNGSVGKIFYYISSSDTQINSVLPIANATINYKDFAILLNSQIVFATNKSLPLNNFSLINSAYACSPPIPYTDENIDSIVISATKDFDKNYLAGSNLNDLFDISNFSNGLSSLKDKVHLKDYFKIERPALESFILTLRQAPEITTDFVFLVKYYQRGVDFKTFEFSTSNVVITR